MRSIIFLFISICLAFVAVFYRSADQVYYGMARAMASRSEWGLHAEGIIKGEQLKIDFINHSGQAFARVAYAPLKIINNQWIELLGDNAIVTEVEPLDSKRLFPIKHNGSWYDRYLFTTSTAVLDLIPDLKSVVGEIWFPFKITWPWQELAILPAYGILNFNIDQPPIVLTFVNNNVFDEAMFAQSRKLSEVLAQLEAMKNTRNSKPKTLVPLAIAEGADLGFTSDFDKDGLSDGLEIFYGTDPANPDTDNDKFLDGEEVKRGYSPVGK